MFLSKGVEGKERERETERERGGGGYYAELEGKGRHTNIPLKSGNTSGGGLS